MDQNVQTTMPQQAEVPMSPVKKPARRKQFFIVTLIILVVAAIVGAVYYIIWLNSPEKIVADSIHNTLVLQQTTYKATYSNQAKDLSGLRITVDGKYNKSQGYALTASMASAAGVDETKIDANMVFDTQGNSYYNYTNVNASATNTAQNQESSAFLQTLKARGNANWIKAAAGGPQQSSACVLVGLQKLQSDKTTEQNLVAALVKTGGVTITTVSTTGDTVVYDLKAQAGKEDALVQAYQASDLSKALEACTHTSHIVTAAAVKQSDIRLTINKKAREITAVTVKNGTTVVDLTLSPAQNISVAVPTSSQIVTTTASLPQ